MWHYEAVTAIYCFLNDEFLRMDLVVTSQRIGGFFTINLMATRNFFSRVVYVPKGIYMKTKNLVLVCLALALLVSGCAANGGVDWKKAGKYGGGLAGGIASAALGVNPMAVAAITTGTTFAIDELTTDSPVEKLEEGLKEAQAEEAAALRIYNEEKTPENLAELKKAKKQRIKIEEMLKAKKGK